MGISKCDPSTMAFNEAFNAVASEFGTNIPGNVPKAGGAWPVLAFLGFIITAPYLISKLVGQVRNTAVNECEYPLSAHPSPFPFLIDILID